MSEWFAVLINPNKWSSTVTLLTLTEHRHELCLHFLVFVTITSEQNGSLVHEIYFLTFHVYFSIHLFFYFTVFPLLPSFLPIFPLCPFLLHKKDVGQTQIEF